MIRPPPRVSILIVSYNTRDMTLECIRSIFTEARSDAFEVIVVDNASSDGSATAIEKEFPQVQLVRLPKNIGFAAANNLAAERGFGKYNLLLNPDTIVLDGAVDELLSFAAMHPDAGIWGGRTVFQDGTLNPTSCWRFMSLWSLLIAATGLSSISRDSPLLNPERYPGWRRDSVREVDMVTGCFLLIERSLWQSLGGFDEAFFMYAEEADLCYRARHFGARPLFTPDATIIHHGGASDRILSDKIVKLRCGMISFINKHWSRRRKVIGINLLKLGAFTRALCYTIVAVLSPSDKHRSKAAEWRTVWSLRESWTKGYPGATSQSRGKSQCP